jgi:cysteine desulfurase
MSKTIYLDYAAATPLDPRVLKAMEPYFTKDFYNPSASYLAARGVRQKLGEARADIARCLGAKPAEIIFTAGATEANNLAIQGVMKTFPGKELLVSAIEHESILAPASLFKSKQIKVSPKGIVDLADLKKKITDDTVLISVMMVNNEIGTIQPLREVAATVKEALKSRQKLGNKLPLYLHSDAAQAGNYFELKTNRLGVDMLSINGGKIYGPKQSGVLFVKAGVKLKPLILGGGQEFGIRSGTENLAGAVGLARALGLAQGNREAEARRVNTLKNFFASEIEKNIPGAILNMSSNYQAPHIVSVTFPRLDNERLMMQLDEAGIICAVGSACSTTNDEPSHVLAAIGLNEKQAHSTLRFSFGRFSSKSDVRKTTRLLKRFILG